MLLLPVLLCALCWLIHRELPVAPAVLVSGRANGLSDCLPAVLHTGVFSTRGRLSIHVGVPVRLRRRILVGKHAR